jgi:hypothetical protein
VTIASRRKSARREFAEDTQRVVDSARKTRASLMGVVELAGRRRREVVEVDDAGFELIQWVALTPEDKAQSLRMAMRWLQEAEDNLRQTRVLLERGIEHIERRTL